MLAWILFVSIVITAYSQEKQISVDTETQLNANNTLQTTTKHGVSPQSFGAICDGQSHRLSEQFSTLTAAQVIFPVAQSLSDYTDWAAWQSAANKGALIVTMGDETCRTNKPLQFNNHIQITGNSPDVNHFQSATRTPDTGSWFYFDHKGVGMYFRDSSVIGLPKKAAIYHLGTYRNQPVPSTSFSPNVNDYDIVNEFHLRLQDLLLLNATYGLKNRSSGVIDDAEYIRGQPLNVGIFYERSPDNSHWRNIRFTPMWSTHSSVLSYQINNSIGMLANRVDGLFINHFFTIFFNLAIKHVDVDGYGSGLALFDIKDVYADEGCGTIDLTANHYPSTGVLSGIIETNASAGKHSNPPCPTTAMPGIHIAGKAAASIDIDNLWVTRSMGEALRVEGAAHHVRVKGGRIGGYNFGGAAYNTPGHFGIVAKNGAIININSLHWWSGTWTTRLSKDASSYIGWTPEIVPGFSASLISADQALVGDTLIHWDKVAVDTISAWKPANWRYAPNVPGYYEACGTITTTAMSGQTFSSATWIKNGTNVLGKAQTQLSSNNFSNSVSLCVLVNMNGTTDYLQLMAGGDGLFPKIVSGSGTQSSINISWRLPN